MTKEIYLYRITHYKNLPFILANGLHCPNSGIRDENFISIGFPTLIASRNEKIVPVLPGGTLADYIPFYFTEKSPMLYVISHGNDPEVIKTAQREIVYLVTTLKKLEEHNCRFVFTDRHAKLELAAFYNQAGDLEKLNWEIIRSTEWGRQYGSDRKELKQAEFLVHRFMPVEVLLGIACKEQSIADEINIMELVKEKKMIIKVKPNYYF